MMQKIVCNDGSEYVYKKLCICSGSSPNLISAKNEHVLGLRDIETVKHLQSRLANARQVLVVGNGGIATELVYEIENCNIVWAIKDEHISHVFFDAHAAKFFDQVIINKDKAKEEDRLPTRRAKYTLSSNFDA